MSSLLPSRPTRVWHLLPAGQRHTGLWEWWGRGAAADSDEASPDTRCHPRGTSESFYHCGKTDDKRKLHKLQKRPTLHHLPQLFRHLAVNMLDLQRRFAAGADALNETDLIQKQTATEGLTRRKWRLYFLICSRMFSSKSSSLRISGPMALTSSRSASARISLSAESISPCSFFCCKEGANQVAKQLNKLNHEYTNLGTKLLGSIN